MIAQAVVTDGDGGIDLLAVDVAEPLAGEVLVELHASGVCHTDHDLRAYPGLVLGHEGAGVVMAVGPGVDTIGEGDRVVLNWAMSCGRCFNCTRGATNLCETGSPLMGGPRSHAHPTGTTRADRPLRRAFGLGTMSTATLVTAEAVTPLPDGIPFTSACIVGCGVMTGFGSVVNAAAVEPGSSVVVLGCGGVGLNVVQAARLSGATPIIAVDTRESRLDMALRFGATDVLQADAEDRGLLRTAGVVRGRTGGRGADYAFECTAVPALGAAPLAMVRHGGTAIQVSGIEEPIEIDMRLFEWDKTYLNPLYGQCDPRRDFPRIFELYRSGQLLLDELVTRTYQLSDVATAFDDLLAGRNAKGVLLMR